MVKLISLVFFLIFTILLIGAGAVVFWGIDEKPHVAGGAPLTPKDVDRAKRLIKQHNPRNIKDKEVKQLIVTQRDLDVLLRYTLARFPVMEKKFHPGVVIDSGKAKLTFTIALPSNPLGKYVNMVVTLSDTNRDKMVKKITIGHLTLTGWMLEPVMLGFEQILKKTNVLPEVTKIAQAVKTVNFEPQKLLLVYEWRTDVSEQIKKKGQELLIPPAERERLLAYDEKLVQISNAIQGKTVSLATFLSQSFGYAMVRSQTSGDPIAENRSSIIALSLFVNRIPITLLVGDKGARSIDARKKTNIILKNRSDLTLHFMVSAAMAAFTNSELANAAGLFKEIDDSKGGSGFSFVDLLADRAGVRLAEKSVGDVQSALKVQQVLSTAMTESVFMPDIQGLNEGLMEKTFKHRYGDLDSTTNGRIKADIENRIDSCALYR